MRVAHEVNENSAPPVIRAVVKLYDHPDRVQALETLIHVAEEDQRTGFAALGGQAERHLLFYEDGQTYQNGASVRPVTNSTDAQSLRAHIVKAGYSS